MVLCRLSGLENVHLWSTRIFFMGSKEGSGFLNICGLIILKLGFCFFLLEWTGPYGA